MRTALVLGGTGSLSATVERLAAGGWQVTVTGRNPRAVPSHWAELGVRFHVVDRNQLKDVADAVGDGLDLLVDGQCYTPRQAEGLSRWSHRCGSAVMLSARAVYVDSRGRHLNSEDPAEWDGPTTESQPTMLFHGEEFASRGGYGANKAEAERTTSTATLADAVMACANDPVNRLLNVADADPQPARRLAALVARAAGADLQHVDVDAECPPPIGLLPWNQDNILDTFALKELGVQPATFADTIRQEVGWVMSMATRGRDGRWQLPEWFHVETPDYESEEQCRPA